MRALRQLIPLLLCTWATLLGLTAVATAATDTPPRIVLILDASGSMWGQVEGRAKIDVARDVIRDLAHEWDPRIEVGLTVYGHRDRRDCADIETLLPVGPPDEEALMAAVHAIRPKGMTPIGAALEHAAKQLDYRKSPAAVVLVSDGNETCEVDPCEMARRLEAQGINFTAHVIGFDVTSEERAQLQCLAEATEGLFLTADNTESLVLALRTAVRDAAQRRGPGLWLGAVLGPDSAPLSENVFWRIVRLPSGTEPPGAPVIEAHQPTLSPALAAGRYRVTVRYDGVSGSVDIDHDATRRAQYLVNLEAGQLEVSAVGRDEQPIQRGLSWAVRREGEQKPLVEARASSHRFTLGAGRYRVEGTYDDSTVGMDIVLRPSQVMRKRFQFGIGRLSVRAVLAEGRHPIAEPIHWQIHRAEKRRGTLGDKVVDEKQPTGLHKLQTGHYRISAQHGETSAQSWVEIKSGVTLTHTLNLAAARVRVFGSLPAPGGSVHDPVQWEIFDLEMGSKRGKQAEPIARQRSASHLFILPAGSYLVSGHHDKLAGGAEVSVRAGEEASVNVTLR